jgi:hypothetical protein
MPGEILATVWVLSDVIRSMDHKIITAFFPLIPLYKKWSLLPDLSSKD